MDYYINWLQDEVKGFGSLHVESAEDAEQSFNRMVKNLRERELHGRLCILHGDTVIRDERV